MLKELKKWTKSNSYRKEYKAKNPPSYPNEMLVKICSSTYFSKYNKKILNSNIKVCEIGCFAGNNMRFFLEKKAKVYGIEINKNLISLCKKNLSRFNYKNKPNLKIGHNLNIPFKNKIFDLFISINTIHYTSGQKINEVIENYKRVVKKNGIIILETPAPKHEVFSKCKKIGKFQYKYINKKDFRDNQILGLFSGKKEIKNFLSKHFKKFQIFIRTEDYDDKVLQFFQVICIV